MRVLVALLLLATPARAADLSPLFELTVGPGWRVALAGDGRAPSFEALTAGVDAIIGLEIGGTAALLGGARVRAGRAVGSPYLEVAGDLGAQLRIGERVRARAGASAGRAWLTVGSAAATVVGGWTALGFDLRPVAGGRLAWALGIRIDLGAFPGAGEQFPVGTMALCAGFGGRY